MRKNWVQMVPVLLIVIILQSVAIRVAFGNPKIEEVVEGIRKKIVQEEIYEFGTVKEATIVPDKKAVLFKCNANPEDVKEILIGANSKHLYIYCIYTSGSISGGGSTWKEGPGSFRQVGGSVAIGMWEHRDGEINIQFQLTNEDNAIVQSYKKLEKAGKSFPNGRFSLRIKSWGALLDNPELIFPRLTPAQRVEAFTRLWSTVKFNFANFDLVPDLNWDNVLSEYLPKVMRDQSNKNFAKLLVRCIAELKDGHTDIRMKFFEIFDQAQPALVVNPIEGKAIVTELGNSKEIVKANLKIGDEILKIDSQDVSEFLQNRIYPYIFASTDQWRNKKAFRYLLRGPENSEVNLLIKSIKGEQRNIVLARTLDWGKYIPRKNYSDFEYRNLIDKISYVTINTFGNSKVVDKFKKHMDRIRSSQGLIIDVRKNGGGSSSNGHAIIAQLIDKAIPATRWKTPQYRAAFRAWGRDEQWYDGGSKMINPETSAPFLGPVVVLIGAGTNSAAEDFVVPLHAAGRATIVGQKSRGSTGQPLQFSFLNGKIHGRVCTKRDTYPDGREFVGVGIIPDVEVHPKPKDIVAGRDVVLEKALEVLHSKTK